MNTDSKDDAGSDLYRTLARALWLGFGMVLALWFLDQVVFVVLFFVTVIVLAIALNPPVRWLERRKVPRVAGALLVAVILVALAGLLGWLVVPRLTKEVVGLAGQAPDLASSLVSRVSHALGDGADLQQSLNLDAQSALRYLPSAAKIALRVGRYSFSLLASLLLLVVLGSTVLYTLAQPRPLLKGYVAAFPPPLREPAVRAFVKSEQAISGWLWSNVIVGAVEAVCAGAFLYWLGVPGALIWAALTFFSELVPRLGTFLMSLPPALVAFAVDPMKALWVLVFYTVLNELTSDFLAPPIRSKQMDIHPLSQMFVVLALAGAFGFIGALLATPITAVAKAFYEEFYLARQPEDPHRDRHTKALLDEHLGGPTE